MEQTESDIFIDNTFNDNDPNQSIEQMLLPTSKDSDAYASPVDVHTSSANQAQSLSKQNMFSCIRGKHELGGEVRAIAYSPDGKTIAIGGTDNKVTLLDSVTMDIKIVHEREGAVWTVAYSPDGNTIAVGGEDKKVAILGSSTLDVITECERKGHVAAVEFLSDGKYIIVGGLDEKVSILKTSTLEVVSEYRLGFEVRTVAVSPDNNTVAVGGTGGKVVLLQIPNLKYSKDLTMNVLKEHKRGGNVNTISFSPNGKYIAVGGGDRKVVLLNSSTLKVCELHERGDAVYKLSFSHTGKYVAIVGAEGKIVILETSTWEVVREYERGSGLWAVAFAPDSKIVTAGRDDNTIGSYDISSGVVYKYESNAAINTTVLAPNGESLTIAKVDNTIRIENFLTGKVLEHTRDNSVFKMVYSPNSKCIAFGDGKKVVILNSLTGEMLHEHELDDQIKAINYSPDGKHIAVGGNEKVNFLDSSSYVLNTKELKGVGNVDAIAYSSDNEAIAVGGGKGKVMILEASTLDIKVEITHKGWVLAIVFSPDDKTIVVGGGNNKLVLYDTSTAKVLREYEQGGGVWDIKYTPDNKYITVSKYNGDNKTLVLLDPNSELKPVRQPILFPDIINSISFYQGAGQSSSADSYCVAAAYENTCIIMNLHKQSCTPAELLVRTKVNDYIDFIKTNHIPTYSRRDAIQAAMSDEKPDIVTKLIHDDPSLAVQNDYVDNDEKKLDGLFEFMFQRRLLNGLNKIADCESFKANTVLVQLSEILQVLPKLAATQNNTTVLKLLSSGEKDMMEGFVVAGEMYAMEPPKYWDWLPKVFQFMKEDDKLPLAFELPPRSSSTPNLDSRWEDLKKDDEKRVRLMILRVLLPDLASFSRLRSLLKMKDSSAFETKALRASIDANWESWAKRKYRNQAVLYFLWLLSFTAFCELTKDQIQPDNLIVYFLTVIMGCGVCYFIWRELHQFNALGWIEYFTDPWNVLQWIGKALVIATVVLRFFFRESFRANAYIAATSLFFSWVDILFYLRGVEDCAWILIALTSIVKSMKYFLLVLAIIIITFALVLRALYNDSNTSETSAFNNLWHALRTTIFAGVFGDFDLGILDETYSSLVAEIIMIVMLILVMIISLNALIAFISDAFEQVLAKKQAVLKKEKAQMIIEVYGSLTEEERKKIEGEHRWTSIVIPLATLEVQESKAVNTNFAKATKEDMNKMTKTNKIMKGDIDEVKDGMKVMKEDIDRTVMKEDIVGMVMKEDIDRMVMKEDIDRMVMKEDIVGIVMKEDIDGMVMKEDIDGMVMKEDIVGLVMKEDIDGMVMKEDIDGMKDGMKVMKEDIDGMKKSINGMVTKEAIDGMKESIDAMMKLITEMKK